MHVTAHRLARREALHRGRSRVVGLQDIDRAGPRHPRDVAEVDDGHRDRRHQQVADLGQDVRVRRWRGEDRQPAELDADDDDQDRRGDELGDRRRGHPEQHDRPVHLSVASSRGVQPGRDGGRDRDEQGQAGELGRAPGRRRGSGAAPAGQTRTIHRSRGSRCPRSVRRSGSCSGRLVPSRSLRASTLSCGANGPRIVRPTSRGQHVGDREHDRDQQPQCHERQQEPAR